MATYVIVHGGWHSGELFEPTAAFIRARGHQVFLPTLVGNRPGDTKTTGLEEVIQSLEDFFIEQHISDAVVVGHSYGGMVITGVADRLPSKIRRLVYWNAFVPNNGESLNDMLPPDYVALFEQLENPDGSMMLPFSVWCAAFFNDGSLDAAQAAHDQLNPHPNKTFKDSIVLSRNPAEMQIPKSYLNGTEDIAMPPDYPWHPRLSDKLGAYRLIEMPGSHELCFTNPELLAEKILEAGRD